MVKAKDLLNQTDDSEEADMKKIPEEDRVNDAYESLTKRLDQFRKDGKDEENEEDDDGIEDELEEDESPKEPDDSDEKEDKEEGDLTPKKTFEKEPEDEKEEPEDPLDQDEDMSEKEIESQNEKQEEDQDLTDQTEEEPEQLPKSTTYSSNLSTPTSKHSDLDDLAEEDDTEPRQTISSMGKGFPSDDNDGGGEEEEGSQIPSISNNPLRRPQEDRLSDFNSQEDQPIINRRNTGATFNQNSPLQADRDVFGRYNTGPRPRGASKMHLLVLALIGIGVIGGTVYLLKNQFKLGGIAINSQTPAPSATVEPVQTPEPTPQAIDRSQFKVRVLNGTSKTGLAGTVSEKLKGLGYQMEKAGNATNSAFTQTTIRLKPSADAGLVDQLVKDLAPDYQAASSSSALRGTDAADAEVILGAQ